MKSGGRYTVHVPHWLTVGVLILAFGVALTSASQKSATMDEQNHIARGAAYLGTGDPRLSIEHPPIVNVLSALPAHLLLDLRLPLDSWWEAAEWYHFADSFLWHSNPRPDRIVFLSRLPIIGLGLLLTSLVFRWADARFGAWSGLLAAAFCALDPNVLAHERLSTTDIGGAFFILLAAYSFWQLSTRPCAKRALQAGVALGLAFAAKLSALIFAPILAGVLLVDGLRSRSGRAQQLLYRLGLVALAGGLAILVVWASYLFQVGHIEGVSFPVPASPYAKGVQAVLGLASGGRPAYLLGEISTEGWWYYFPVAFAVKTPLPALVGLLASSVIMVRRPRRDDLFILAPPLLFFAALTTARLNLGYRHLLPILPFVAIHIARLAQQPSDAGFFPGHTLGNRLRCYACFVLAAWLAVGTISIYPHFLAYFNSFGGGPKNGWRVLVDSNLDWGQDLKGLREWMDREGVDEVKLSWFGSAPPEAYGVEHELLVGVPHGFEMWEDPPFNPDQPEPGVYAISVTNLVGAVLPDHGLYAWFLRRPPDDRVGYSIFIYRVTAP